MVASFGELLRRFRIAASLTQEALAERCRISPATVAAIEQGRRNAPRLSTVLLIAEALKLSAADREALATAADAGRQGRSPGLGRSQRPPSPPPVPSPISNGPPSPQPANAQVGPGQVTGLQPARTSFVGRDAEQAAILAALAEGRLVSLVGPGGVGKTRLAAWVAELAAPGYPSGAVFVDLVPVRAGFVTQAVAALAGVAERPGVSLDAALLGFLARGRLLLVLDNCEHLLEVAAAFTEKLLANCAELTILVTSRERLGIPGERTVTVPPLSLSGAAAGGGAGSEAEALFLDRARGHDPGFAATPAIVGEVCTRLDGIPLAIELAAARSASLGVDGLLAGLNDHLRLLVGSRGPTPRHRSLRAVLDWSHDLLDADEHATFRRVGVFTGGFDLDAAAAVCPASNRGEVADLTGRLTDKSLLYHRRGPGGSRWQMLETVRAYALDRLADSGEENQVRDAYLRWAAGVADGLERRVESGLPWRAAFDTVADDLRAAVAAPPAHATGEASYRLASALGHLAYARRFMVESREHYLAAAARAPHPAQAALDLRRAADVAMAAGHGGMAFDLLLAAADRARAAGDGAARTASLAYAVTIADRFAAQFPDEVPTERLDQLLDEAADACPPGDTVGAAYLAAAAAWVAQLERTVPEPELAPAALDAARLTGDPVLISGALDAVVGGLDAGGRLREAHRVNAERARLLDRLPRHDPRAGAEIIDTFYMVTAIAVTAGDLPAALATAKAAADDEVAGGQPHMTASKPILPLVLQGRFDEALAQAGVMWESWQRAGRPAARWMGPATYGVVLAHGLRGDDAGRRDWIARVEEVIGTGIDQVSGTNLAAVGSFVSARVALHAGDLAAAVAAVAGLPREAQPWYETPAWYSLRPYAWAIAAEVAVVAGLPDAPDRLAAAAPAGDENYWASACLDRAAGRLKDDRDALLRSLAGWERIEARFERACTLTLLPGRGDEGRAELSALGCRPPAGS
jgi:predicted ATPase/DNA-binding XRE family transcriptional regulator